jgi:hypothetical protein
MTYGKAKKTIKKMKQTKKGGAIRGSAGRVWNIQPYPTGKKGSQ